MLRKIYLVSAEHFQNFKVQPLATNTASEGTHSPKKQNKERKNKKSTPQHPYVTWFKMSKKIWEDDVTRKAQVKETAKFLKQIAKSP